jgi:addiction module HigA family antidote
MKGLLASVPRTNRGKYVGVKAPTVGVRRPLTGQRRISADTALRLARFFGTSERFWINLQSRYDLEVERTGWAMRSMASARHTAAS